MSSLLLERLRHFAYRFKYRYGQRLPLSTPVDVSLELASHCNMKCSYCYHGDQENIPFQKGLMDLYVGERIIRQAATLGVHSLKFNWKGESTINPHFYHLTSLAKYLANGSTFIERLTNSNFKFHTSRDDIFRGLCNQTKVKVSLDSFRKSVFETQRTGGAHEVTMRNIDTFYNDPRRKDTEIVIQAVRTQLNKDEDIEGEAKKRWPHTTISIRDMVAGRTDKDVSHLESRQRDVSSERQSCLQAHVRLIFNWKGVAFPCCPDIGEKLSLGSIQHQSLYEIFNSVAAKRLRASLKDKSAFESNPCLTCSSFETFKGFKPAWNS